uniref:Uncharacterized protein n=1 Tax=Acrobeloides nanus TaxID=290746 RepID=A0A914EJK3_9BILA
TNFFLSALGTFNIATGPNNPTGTHFAIIQVPGDSWGVALISATFDTITSYNMLQTAFANAWPDPRYDPPQSPGQTLLKNATALIVDPNLLNSGYRTNINNHLVIYVTTKSVADQGAISIAQSINTNGTYSFLALAYKSDGSNIQSLTSYVSNKACLLYQATDSNSLNSQATTLAELIFSASTTGQYTC